MKHRQKKTPVVFDDPATSLRKATSTTRQERERVAEQMKVSTGGLLLPAVRIAGVVFPAMEYRP